MARIRKDVWNLTRAEGDWPAVLVDYQRAVGLLRAADPPNGPPTNPLGWRFLAAIHGRALANGNPDTSNALWCNCQHGSWYFLPWHRMYLMAFELAVQNVLADDQWSLPYWYAVDPDDPGKAVLPPAFRDRAAGNDLFTTRRSALVNSGAPLGDALGGVQPVLNQSVIDALGAPQFSTPLGTSTFGGGERSTPSFNGDEIGLLEDVPHGAVHTLVGNDFDQNGNPVRSGWMGSFFTAAQDPIFWLHHSNVDRLWQVWLDANPAHVNPTGDPAWAATTFSFPAVGGGLVSWSIGEVVDAANIGYAYESTALPSGMAPPPPPLPIGRDLPVDRDLVRPEAPVPEPLPPEMLGATLDVPIAARDAVEVQLAQPVSREFTPESPAGSRLFLRIEGITGTAAAPMYQVYLNVPPGDAPEDHPELRAGTMSTFGVTEASQRNQIHDGSGLTKILDITPVRDTLAEEGRWDPSLLTVTFRPVIPSAPDPDDAAGALPGGVAEARPADLRAGQLTVITT